MGHLLAALSSRLGRIGIIPALLAASLCAEIVAVVIVQGWTLSIVGEAQENTAQSQLDAGLGILEAELLNPGAEWRLGDDGRLMLNGKIAEGLDKAVDEVSRIIHGVATVFAGDKRVATTVKRPDGTRATGTILAPGPARDAVYDRHAVYRGPADILGVHHLTVYEPLRDPDGKEIGILFVGIPDAVVRGVSNKIIWQTSLSAVVVVLLVGLGNWLMIRVVLRPMKALAAAVRTISDGHLDAPAPCADRTDQLGEIGRALEMLRGRAKQAQELETLAVAEQKTRAGRQSAVDQLTHDFGTSLSSVLAGLITSADSMRGSAAEMADAAAQTHRDMASTTADAAQSSMNLSQVAAAAEQLTASVTEISHQVAQAAQVAQDAVDQARATDTTVRQLSEAAGQIGEVVGLISNIAAQTNLLALNATIEAARAGDAGKGFAVVADEVKQLAAQTAQATRRIGLQVGAIQASTGDAANAVMGVTAAIAQVSQIATTIAAAVEQQGAATREIAEQVSHVAQATDSAAQAMLGVSTTAERSGQTSQTFLISADRITQISGTLRDEVDHFMQAMRQSAERTDSRKYVRSPGGNAVVTLRGADAGSGSAMLIDISLGGAGLSCDWRCQVGTEINLVLPGSGQEVSSRVVNLREGCVAVAFRQDRETLDTVGRAIDWIAERVSGQISATTRQGLAA